jgi:metal-responsive CopG/Arc/MetJ family transcriptional regulator
MKTKTSITLSADILELMDRQAGTKSRSEFIETALWAYVSELARRERDAGDLMILNRDADLLNEEAIDVLAYQTLP